MPERKTYAKSSIVFRTDHAGNPIAVRPNQIIVLVPADDHIDEVNKAVNLVLTDMSPERSFNAEILANSEVVRGRRFLFTVTEPCDVIRLVRGLREIGISAQPNHVYFVNSLNMAANFDPNMFAPNMFAPNMFAPNMFAPNMFAPNMFAPNMFAAGFGGCCCPIGLSELEDSVVPQHQATPIDPDSVDLHDAGTVPADQARVQTHIIDVSTQGKQVDDRPAPVSEEKRGVDENSDNWLDPATGHGVFVKDILDRHSGLKSKLHELGSSLGDIDDATLVRALATVAKEAETAAQANEALRHKVLNLSLSGYTENDMPSLVLADEIKAMVDQDWLIVAAAGNNASCRLTWPAALPGVVAVGALNGCLPAWFSNYGRWVDASAAGVNVVAAFPDLSGIQPVLDVDGDLTTDAFGSGLAQWSGTSFSTPFVAAKLAAWLQANSGADNADAIDAVLNGPNVQRLPFHGSIVK